VIADGQTGRLVAPRSPEALAAGIMDFVASPGAWRAFAARGRDVVETQFDFGTRTRKLEALYGELAGVAHA
jgi:glycosyltransferase involved in cell wall biosynthesis